MRLWRVQRDLRERFCRQPDHVPPGIVSTAYFKAVSLSFSAYELTERIRKEGSLG